MQVALYSSFRDLKMLSYQPDRPFMLVEKDEDFSLHEWQRHEGFLNSIAHATL